MSEREESEAVANENAGTKSEEIGENLGNEESSATLEAETVLVRNGVQAASKDKAKIAILLKATGNAPIMRQKRWFVNEDHCIGRISNFVRKYLKLDTNEKLFLYVNQTFAPAPDQVVKNLYDCYGSDGKLILHYCKSQAWG